MSMCTTMRMKTRLFYDTSITHIIDQYSVSFYDLKLCCYIIEQKHLITLYCVIKELKRYCLMNVHYTRDRVYVDRVYKPLKCTGTIH